MPQIGQERINELLAQVHSRTSARIIPVVCRDSGHFDRAEELVGFYAAFIGLAIILGFVATLHPSTGWTPPGGPITGVLLPILAAIVSGFCLGALLVGQLGRIKRFFVPRDHLQKAVQAQAQQFLEQRRTREPDAPAALVIYVSLADRACAVLAGPLLAGRVDADELESIRRQLIEALNENRPEEGLCLAIQRAAGILAGACPASNGMAAVVNEPTMAS